MTNSTHNPKKLLVAGGALFAALMLPMAASYVTSVDNLFIGSAQAAESGGHSGSGGSGQAQKGKPASAGGAQGGGGGAMGKKIFRAPVSTEEDSDRPIWAGVKGGKAGGGGRPAGAGTKKGDLFGDMVVILRNENGEPITTTVLGETVVQPLAFVIDPATGLLVPLLDASGNPVPIPYILVDDPATPADEAGTLATTVTIGTTTYEVQPAEVDLGRLSVGRAPTKVLDKSLTDALNTLATSVLSGYIIDVDATGRLTIVDTKGTADTADDVVVSTIDSPLSNLALYDAVMSGSTTFNVKVGDQTVTITLPADLEPAALFAAASDKTGTIIVDTIVYMNSILGINNLAADPDVYYNFSSVDYDRYTTWKDVNVTVLVQYTNPDGSIYFVPESVNVYNTVFDTNLDGVGDNWVDPTTTGGADDFATMANDYLQVIEFVHDNAVR